MARPKTKAELVEASDARFAKLWVFVDAMSPEEQSTEFDFSDDFLAKHKEAHWGRDKNLRDVLVHLHEWHRMLLEWVEANHAGEERAFLPAPYNWRTYGPLNHDFVEKHQTTSLAEAESLVRKSHNDVMAMINGFSDEELFEKGRFPWTGGSTLGSYCVSTTSSHYDWAVKKLKSSLAHLT